jgi:hypothetical protein
MALHLDPYDHTGGKARRVREGLAGDLRQVVRDGVQTIARGALACPSCALPLSPPPPRIDVAAELSCGWCGHADRARGFVARDVLDTSANSIVVTARLRDRAEAGGGRRIRIVRRTASIR